MSFLEKIPFLSRLIAKQGNNGRNATAQDPLPLLEEAQFLEKHGRFTEALSLYDKTIIVEPGLARAHLWRGNLLVKMGDANSALAAYTTALSCDPEYAAALFNLGNTHYQLGQYDKALVFFRQAIAKKPDFADAEVSMGCVHEDLGQFDEAIASYRRALKIKPDYAEVHRNLGNLLKNLRRFEEALVSLKQAENIKADAETCGSLGNIHAELREYEKAIAYQRRAIAIDPGSAIAHNNLGNLLKDMGQLEEAEACFRKSFELAPENDEAFSNLLFCLGHKPNIAPEELFDEHRKFGEHYETAFTPPSLHQPDAHDFGRRLKIGFVSGDFFHHAVASFFEPILAHLAKKTAFELHGYHNRSIEDHVTGRIRSHFSAWHPIAGLPDAEVANRIRRDKIDILIDLSGHTGLNRLLCFARKPAPIQASWMGYPGTTGLRAMDYYLGDRFLLPPGKFDAFFTEKLVYLPANAPFLPYKEAPAVNPLPALNNKHVTFGSFNRPGKLSPPVIALWSRLLHALPNARLLLGAMQEDGSSNYLLDWFDRNGIPSERLQCFQRSDVKTYLSLHHEVDLCLDTFPYSGGTTTLQAMWMGVPTITWAMNTVPSMQSATWLGHLELKGFAAESEEMFINIGTYWSEHTAELAEVRAGLRDRLQQSVLLQPEIIANGLEQALLIMWKRWCSNLPPDTIDASFPQTDCKQLKALP